jgi:glycosidase
VERAGVRRADRHLHVVPLSGSILDSATFRREIRGMRFRFAVTALVALAPLTSFAILQGCSSDVDTTPKQTPPDSWFDPGDAAAGGGDADAVTIDSAADTTPADTRPQCTDDLKRCGHDFVLPYNGESTVEVRGDYRSDGWTKGDPMAHVGSNWQATVPVPYNQPVLYKYVLNGTSWIADPNNPNKVSDGYGGFNSKVDPTTCADWTCADPVVPAGTFDWRDSVIYFVFVDRFFNGDSSNDGAPITNVQAPGAYHGGDWAGVTKKIQDGYFTQLGVNTLWLTVPMQNADAFAGLGTGGDSHYYSAYHGYWPKEPDQAEKRFGTLAELKALVAAAHTAKLKVLFDYAMVHVQKDSTIYQNHSDWFWPNDNGKGSNCICGGSCDWNTDGQKCWFTDYLPHWNYTNSAARKYSVDNVIWWIQQTGVDGLRLDAIKHVDGSWLTDLRSRVNSDIVSVTKERFYMVGETYDFGNRDFIKSFVDPATKLDGQFDFPERLNLVQALLMRSMPISDLKNFMDSNDGYYGNVAVMSPFVGNHDMGRVIHMAEDTPKWDAYDNGSKNTAWVNQPTLPSSKNPFERLANAFAVLFTNKGAPLIYYGDEIGLPGAGDPDNRRDMAFTGWSANQTWLHDRVAALLKIRSDHPALRKGTRTTIIGTDPDLWVYKMAMSDGSDTVYVAVNRGDGDKTATGLPASGTELLTAASSGSSATVPARQTRIFVAK